MCSYTCQRDQKKLSLKMASESDRQEFDWDLPINAPTIGVHRTLRVTSNESIGAVMIKLASKLGESVDEP